MNWEVTVNDQIKNFVPLDRHLSISECCQFVGECATTEGTEILIEAIELFLKRPILEISGLAANGEVEFREFHLVEESVYWHGLPVTQKFNFPVPAIDNAWLADILEDFAKRVRAGEDIHGKFTSHSIADTPKGRAHCKIEIDAPRLGVLVEDPCPECAITKNPCLLQHDFRNGQYSMCQRPGCGYKLA